jgi:molybdopterin converting factor small subunit
MMVSVNLEYRAPNYQLGDGDEVAFIPPVSGGRS